MAWSELPANLNVEYLINLVLDEADSYLQQYKKFRQIPSAQEAIKRYHAADQLMSRMSLAQTDLSSRLFWRADSRRLYEQAIESCYLVHDLENAFYFFEKSRAVLLLNQLREQETGDSHMVELAMIRKKILSLERQLPTLDAASTEYSELQRSLFLLKEQSGRIDQLIKDHNPWYYQSLLDTNGVKLKDVQNRLLGKGGACGLLEFFNGENAVYLLTVTAAGSVVSSINKSVFGQLADRFSQYLSNPALENQDYAGFVKTARALYHLIFNQSVLPPGRIILSPDGKYFPFEALITDDSGSRVSYFVNDYAVSYTYSARFLLNEFASNQLASSHNFLGVAPIQFPASFHLTSLLQSDVSLKKIESDFENTRTLIDSEATRNHFMEQFNDFKIIQLFTHASDSSLYGEPVIYFADSALYLSELVPESRMATQLIVLSACETGKGSVHEGEGVFSFNRGFAALGIPSAVINLWSVEDESTYKLTELFYKYVQQGLPLDLALQRAKKDFISTSPKEKSLPFYWAAAVLVGKTDPNIVNSGIQKTAILMVLGLVIVILLIWKWIIPYFKPFPAK